MTFSRPRKYFDDFIVHPTLNNEGPSKGGTTSTHCHFVYSPVFFWLPKRGGEIGKEKEGEGRGKKESGWVSGQIIV